MSFALCYAFVSLFLLLVALMQTFVPEAKRKRPVILLAIFCLAALLLFLPIEGQSLFYYLRGFTADLSITFTIFLFTLILQRGLGIEFIKPAEKKYFTALVVLGAVFLYPFALGLAQFDSYRLGFNPQGFLLLLFCMGLFFWLKGMHFLVVLLTTASLGFALGLLESNNLWDYLLDPLVSTMFVFAGLMSGLRAAKITWPRSSR